MGVSISIQANSIQEFEALESEGAPDMHVTYGTWGKVADLFGLDVDVEDYVGTVNPVDVFAGMHRARRLAATAEHTWVVGAGWMNTLENRVEGLIEIAHAAHALGREITWG